MNNEDLLTLPEAARYLKKSPSTIYRLVACGKLRCYGAHNQRKLFSRRHLAEYLRRIETPVLIEPVETKHRRKPQKRTYVFQTDIADGLIR